MTRRTTRTRRNRVATAALLLALPLGMVACGDDDTASEISAAVSDGLADARDAAESAVTEISAVADSIGDSITDDDSDEGSAMDLANQVKARLDNSSNPGEPVLTHITDAVTGIVNDPDKVTGIEDADADGNDDDAKFTIETNDGDDKACVQSENGAWEVTDDAC